MLKIVKSVKDGGTEHQLRGSAKRWEIWQYVGTPNLVITPFANKHQAEGVFLAWFGV